MTDRTQLDLSTLKRIDLVCEEFEQAWCRGDMPRIEEYLTRADTADRAEVWKELVRIEIEFRLAAGENPQPDEYETRFPAYATCLDASWFHRRDLPERPPMLRPGDEIGPLQLIRVVGRGGFGEVWLARDRDLNREVAVKFLPSVEPEDGQPLKEAQIAAGLDHPGIVPVYGIGRHGRVPYIVSKYISGKNLKAWYESVKPQLPSAVRLCLKVVEAIQHAHERGIIHRDLKPGNILVDEADRPHVMDFGLAKRIDSTSLHTRPGQILGTLGYMSPEQASGNAHEADTLSDVYGLGAILYHLLTGGPPFRGDSWDVIQKTIHEEPTPPRALNPSVPADLETICLRALCKKPHRRYPSAAAMGADLRRYLADTPIEARRKTIRERIEDGIAVDRRTALLVAAVLLGALLWASWDPNSNNQPEIPPAPVGTRPVRIVTEPTGGAQVAIVPIDETTGEYRIHDILHPEGGTPLDIDLPPGDYLIVAKYDDQRFHEVFRRVPREREKPGMYHHRAWKLLSENGRRIVQFPTITIPDASVIEGMALIPGADRFGMGVSGSQTVPQHYCTMPSFYMDTTEFTEEACKRVADGRLPADKHFQHRSDRHALCVPFDAAVFFAELAGKRLPEEAEYEYVATALGRSRFPWGDEFPEEAKSVLSRGDFSPVGKLAFDRLEVEPPIWGLCSNVAEWTTSPASVYPPLRNPELTALLDVSESRIIRGGSSEVIGGSCVISPETRDPRQVRVAARTNEWKLGVGFRCVRSVSPRWVSSDFVQPTTWK